MSDNWLNDYFEELFSGKKPMENPDTSKYGGARYLYFDPNGMDKNAPLKDWKLIGVPTADTPNPALAKMEKQRQKYSNNFLRGNVPMPQNKMNKFDAENQFTANNPAEEKNALSEINQKSNKNLAKNKQLPQRNPNIYYDKEKDVYCDKSTGFEDDSYNVDLYGEDIPESLVKKMQADETFKRSMIKYVQPNEGCYSNHPEDKGGKTKYGITSNVYSKENIKDLSRQRANAIMYRDFWNFNGMNRLPKEVIGPLFDHSVNVGSPRGIEHIHRTLGIEKGDIIGEETLKRLNSQSYDEFMKKYKDYLYQYYINLEKQDPSQKNFGAGWLNRINGYEVEDE